MAFLLRSRAETAVNVSLRAGCCCWSSSAAAPPGKYPLYPLLSLWVGIDAINVIIRNAKEEREKDPFQGSEPLLPLRARLAAGVASNSGTELISP